MEDEMSKHILVRHMVADFPTWKVAFDNHEQQRQNQNSVTILLAAQDFEKAKKFTQSDDLRDIMHRAGVISKPEVCFLTDSTRGV
jgi:cysteinyl-tRNA synthetase